MTRILLLVTVILSLPHCIYSQRWESIGYATYTDDSFSMFAGYSVQTWNVSIDECVGTPGLYRIVDPYGCKSSPYSSGGEGAGSVWIFDCTDPDKVWAGTCDTGISLEEYGAVTVLSRAYQCLSDGKDPGPWYGKLEEGVITFPVNGLYTFLPEFDATDFYLGNTSGMFRLILPDTGSADDIFSDGRSPDPEYFNLQGYRISVPIKGSVVIRRQGSEVTKIIVR